MASLGILTSVCMCVCVHAYVHVFVSVSEGVHVCVLIFAFCESKRIYMHMLSIWVLFLIFAVFFAFKCMVKKRSGVTGRAEKGESKGWTDCDRDFKVVCEMLASFFYFILFFSILQERAAGVGCFSHVWSLLSRAMLFSAMQRGWLLARENERGGRNKDRIKTEKALTQRLLSLTHFCEH